jgi:hypothetical protein
MPICQLCKTTFLYAGAGGPAEDCDCGANATRETVRQMRDEAVDSGPRDPYADDVDAEAVR